VLSKEALKIAKRMASGEIFYSRLSPRLSRTIRDHLNAHGLEIQSESPRHESTFYYPLHKEKFKTRLEKLESEHNRWFYPKKDYSA
jgi:hypothetical protein